MEASGGVAGGVPSREEATKAVAAAIACGSRPPAARCCRRDFNDSASARASAKSSAASPLPLTRPPMTPDPLTPGGGRGGRNRSRGGDGGGPKSPRGHVPESLKAGRENAPGSESAPAAAGRAAAEAEA